MKIRLIDFIKTSKFGNVELGMTKQDVINYLGATDSITDLGETGEIYVYGWYELFFQTDNILHSIQNDNFNPESTETYEFKNSFFSIDPWIMKYQKSFSIDNVSEELASEGVDF